MRQSLLAVVALVFIIAVSVAWWSLALWPLDSTSADWIVRTRFVCFGASHTGLPNAGGWVLLIGEPLGMLAILKIVWSDELRGGLSRLHQHLWGKMASAAVLVGLGVGVYAAGTRVANVVNASSLDSFAVASPLPKRSATPAPALQLYNQHQALTDLQAMRGQWVMVTFAFGHCEDMCPLIVQTALQARVDEGAQHVPLIVVSLDPWRDTPDRLPTIAAGWKLAANDHLVSGGIDEVNATLDAWGIPRQRDTTTGDVLHGSTIVVVDPAGRAAWRVEGTPISVREALRRAMVEQGVKAGR